MISAATIPPVLGQMERLFGFRPDSFPDPEGQAPADPVNPEANKRGDRDLILQALPHGGKQIHQRVGIVVPGNGRSIPRQLAFLRSQLQLFHS